MEPQDRILLDDDLLNAYNGVVGSPYNDPHPTLVSNIGMELKYRSMNRSASTDMVSTIHIGQRKLFMNELQFLTHYMKDRNDPATVIYAGSAPSMHLPYLASLFPKVRFILVDPNEHILIKDRAPASGDRVTDITHYSNGGDVAYVTSSPHIMSQRTLMDGTPIQRNIQVWTGRELRMVDPSRYRFPTDYGTIGRRIVSCMRRRNIRYVIAESYFTDELCEELAKLKGPLFFWSDIRTSAGKYPTDANIIYNNIQQMRWVSILGPDASMLKFRAPYYPTDTSDRYQWDKYKDALAELEANRDNPVFQWVYDTYGIDPVEDMRNMRYAVPVGDLYIQPWAGQSSSEVRLRLEKGDNRVYYIDVAQYEDTMFAYNVIIRPFRFFASHQRDEQLGIDGCGDCALEMQIWKEYSDKYMDGRMDLIESARNLCHRVGMSYRPLHVHYHGEFQAPYRAISRTEANSMLEAMPPYHSTDVPSTEVMERLRALDPDATIEEVGLHRLGIAVEGSPFHLMMVTDRNIGNIDLGDEYVITITNDMNDLEEMRNTIQYIESNVKGPYIIPAMVMIQRWAMANRLDRPELGYFHPLLLAEMMVTVTSSTMTKDEAISTFMNEYKNITFKQMMDNEWMVNPTFNRFSWRIITWYMDRGISFIDSISNLRRRYSTIYVTNAEDDGGLLDALDGIYISRIRLYPYKKDTLVLINGESFFVLDMGMRRWMKRKDGLRVRRLK